MRLNEMSFDGLPVDAYGPGFFRIAEEVHKGPLLITPNGPQPWTGLADEAPITALVGQVDVILLGLGADMGFPPASLQTALDELDIGLEAMATPSACRTYNVLLSEGRRIALAALPV